MLVEVFSGNLQCDNRSPKCSTAGVPAVQEPGSSAGDLTPAWEWEIL